MVTVGGGRGLRSVRRKNYANNNNLLSFPATVQHLYGASSLHGDVEMRFTREQMIDWREALRLAEIDSFMTIKFTRIAW